MVTESPLKMMSGLGIRGPIGGDLRRSSGVTQESYADGFAKELGMLLREQPRYEMSETERELLLYRSGSAPPSVEGSLAAVGDLLSQSHGASGSSADGNGKAGGFMSEEDLRSDPAYLAYYYSHVNLNPRLPPPILSREDWRSAHRLQAVAGYGGIGDRRKLRPFNDGDSKSLFSLQPVLSVHKEESDSLETLKQSHGSLACRSSTDWVEKGADGLIGLSTGGLGSRRKSLADLLQEDFGRSIAISRNHSRPASRAAHEESVSPVDASGAHLGNSCNAPMSSLAASDIAFVEGLHSSSATPCLARAQSLGTQSSHAFASAVGASISRSQTPEPHFVGTRSGSPCPPTMGGRFGMADKQKIVCSDTYNNISSVSESEEFAAALASLNISSNGGLPTDENKYVMSQIKREGTDHQNHCFHLESRQNENQQYLHAGKSQAELVQTSALTPALQQSSSGLSALNIPGEISQTQLEGASMPQYSGSFTSNLYAAAGSGVSNMEGSNGHYLPNVCIPNYDISGYSINPMLPSMMGSYLASNNTVTPMFDNVAANMDSRTAAGGLPGGISGGLADIQNVYRLSGQLGNGLQMPVFDPLYVQYLQRNAEYAAQVASGFADPSMAANYMNGSYVDVLEFQKGYMGSMFPQQKSQYNVSYLGKGANANSGYYCNPAFGLAMPYPNSPIASPVLPGSPGSRGSPPIRQCERSSRISSGARSLVGGVIGSWQSENGGDMQDKYGSSLLEEFKNSKTQTFELSEIAGHVAEFSADQHGSRFIQQKLEIASLEDKNMVFQEIFPQALTLMTDVFGNYVIQKFFEHGTANQRRVLANQLSGHILALSLQMYGCRVIQKAIEVVDADQQEQLVLELDGHVMRCVRDQNGNHVIQKCIECIPQDRIRFIISAFFGQVVALSTHPYGCRVIQRVLEHYTDENTQHIMMEEILQSACALAQDQYGNYVVQHVLEHGKPHERRAIIKKLAGQIVQMSQQKFASNVVEKCLAFGSPSERQILISEMLGSTDENEPLQAMMKDQFANYVVQKVLETCDDQQRELILSRIKVHLNALKKYTYGKHIVARVEKLVAAGEKRIGTKPTYLS